MRKRGGKKKRNKSDRFPENIEIPPESNQPYIRKTCDIKPSLIVILTSKLAVIELYVHLRTSNILVANINLKYALSNLTPFQKVV